MPRYPSVPGRIRAKKAPVDRVAPTVQPVGNGRVLLTLPPEETTTVEILGSGAGRGARGRGPVRAARAGGAMTTIAGPRGDQRGRPAPAVRPGAHPGQVGRRRACRRSSSVGTRPRRSASSASRASRPCTTWTTPGWPGSRRRRGRRLSRRWPPATDADAVVAAGTARGNEVLAHLAARLDVPMAAQAVSAAPGGAGEPWRLTRQIMGGAALEDLTAHRLPGGADRGSARGRSRARRRCRRSRA